MNQINFIGLQTLYLKEVRRFLKVYNQTLIAPMVTALLFLAVFHLAVGNHVQDVGNIPFGKFMAAGLIMMSVMQQAFANTSSSFIMGKVLGTLIDYLMAPLSAAEITFGMVMGGVTRGIMVGIMVSIGISLFIPISVHSWASVIFFIIASSMLMSLLGMFTGIFAETFDQSAAITSYVITPLSFLSGTFYSVANLPGFWHAASHYNPFFYMIDGFRYGLTGYHDGNLMIGVVFIIIMNIALWVLVHNLLARGYRIKN